VRNQNPLARTARANDFWLAQLAIKTERHVARTGFRVCSGVADVIWPQSLIERAEANCEVEHRPRLLPPLLRTKYPVLVATHMQDQWVPPDPR
jgi:hypothetical protein